MIEKLDLIQCEVLMFERMRKDNEVMVVSIVSIGEGLSPETID